MSIRRPLIIAAVLPILTPDVALAQPDFGIEEIRLLARPFWHPSLTRPPQPAVDLTAAWQAMDYQDSIIVQVEVRVPDSALGRALVVADVQVAAARALGHPEQEELFDWERMYAREIWLPSSYSFAVPVAEGEQVAAGRYLITLGHFMIEPVRSELNRHDRRLIVTHLRVTTALIAERGEDYSPEQFVERTIIVGPH